MPVNELRKALSGKGELHVRILTANRTYEGDLSPFPSGQAAVGSNSVHLSHVTVTETFVKQPYTLEHVTIALDHIEAYSL